MMMNSIFKTSIKDLVQKNKFFECFVCLQQFDKASRFPMQICERQHFMCLECVQADLFRKNGTFNIQYSCSLCNSNVDKKNIRRSPFLLSIKDFIQNLIQRQKIRKNKYKECLQKQTQLAEQLMNQNMSKTEIIQQLQAQLQQQQQMTKSLLQQLSLSQNIQNTQLGASKIPHKNLLTSKLGGNFNNKEQNQKKVPLIFKSMFEQVSRLKKQIQQNENADQQDYKSKLNELQKHEDYLYKIIEQKQVEEKYQPINQGRYTIDDDQFNNQDIRKNNLKNNRNYW